METRRVEGLYFSIVLLITFGAVEKLLVRLITKQPQSL